MASPNVIEFSESNFGSEVRSGTLVVADFWAPWCGPCRALSPVIDKIADQYAGRVKVGKINVDENLELATKYDISTIPRILMFKGGDQPVFKHVGPIDPTSLAKEIEKHL
jgi:thioredoxin 1